MSNDLSAQSRRAINDYIMHGNKRRAAKAAGFSGTYAYDFFQRDDVVREIERRMKVSEDKTDMDRAYLLEKLRLIIDATPGELLEISEKGRPSMNWKKLSPELKSVMSKLELTTDRPGGKYKRQKVSVKFDTPDQLNAINLAAKLLGLFEEKHTIAIEEGIINRLSSKRDKLAGETDETDTI